MPSITRKMRYLIITALLGVMAIPTAAQANTFQSSIMMDDDLLLYRSDAIRDATMRQMKGLGVDVVRVTVLWNVVAEHANDTKARKKRFKRLGGANPAAYPKAAWDRYDRLARACKTLALTCYFNVTGPGPAYTHAKPPKSYASDAKQWRPNPRLFYQFVQAVGKRYSGNYTDENDGHPKLERVHYWSIWNEPNQGGWLRPQFINNKPVSPAIYRELYLFGRRALVSTGHGKDVILVGETSPLGGTSTRSKSAMGPRQFINELLCGPGSTGEGCSSFQKNGPIVATGWAHHPYTKTVGPNVRDKDPNSITLANIDDLGTLLDSLAPTGNIAAGMPIFSTEMGWETNPPDPFAAVTLDQQAAYLVQAELQTYLDPRIYANTQFLLRDVKPNRAKAKDSKSYWGTYQSGLQTAGGGAKPAMQAYQFPFIAGVSGHDPATGQPIANLFGQLRFLPNGLTTVVHLQWAPPGTSAWTDFGEPIPMSNLVGYFSAPNVVLPGAGTVRAYWAGPNVPGGALASRGVPVS